MSFRRARCAIPPLAAIAALAPGCVADPATAQGREVAWLYNAFMVASAGVFLIVIGLIVWSIVRYRGRPGREVPMPEQVHGNLRLEVLWWALPSALVVLLVVWTASVLNVVDAREEEPELVVEVIGFQWGWEFRFAEADVVVSGTAADPPIVPLPVGRTIAFVIDSADVIHSFNIPHFLIKRDAIPTHENRFDVVITEEGTYGGQCGEFCGLLHSAQLFEIDAVSPAAFEAWLAEQPAAASSEPRIADR